MLKDFKKFVLRGNAVDLAIAVVIGAAFNSVVQSIVTNLITPLIAAIGGQPKFSALSFKLNNSTFLYGEVVNTLVSFLVVATVVFFLVVQPVNKLVTLSNRKKTPEEPTERQCPECLSEIPKAASRCKFCTAKIKPLAKS